VAVQDEAVHAVEVRVQADIHLPHAEDLEEVPVADVTVVLVAAVHSDLDQKKLRSTRKLKTLSLHSLQTQFV
jgi:hypothetical protein